MEKSGTRPVPLMGRQPHIAGNLNQSYRQVEFLPMLAFLGLHIPLVLLIKQAPIIGALHAFATVALGVGWAVSSRHSLEKVAYIGAYIAGAEVLWRMTEARIFWEYGKYAVIAIFLVALLRARRLHGPALPFMYFIFQLPAVILTVAASSLSAARELISFNLSGPFALMICAWYFSHLRFSREQLQRLLLAALGPLLGVSAIVIAGIGQASSIQFTTSSNAALSGGYGPNQVSSAFALGALFSFWLLMDFRFSQGKKILLYSLLVLFLTQSVLTFSRSGLYNTAGSFTLAFLFLLREPRARVKFIFGAALFYLIASYVIWPRLDAFTEGKLSERYLGEQRLSHRDEIIAADLGIFQEYPIFGVGPGMAKSYRGSLFNLQKPAHTEQTRMLAEHGLAGLLALLLLFGMAAQKILQAPTATHKAFAASMVGFSLLYMTHAAMRLVTPALVFGLAYLTFLADGQRDNSLTR